MANLKYHYPRRRFTHSIGWGTLGCESPELFLELAKGEGTDAATGEGLPGMKGRPGFAGSC